MPDGIPIAGTSTNNDPNLERVSVKMPPFWADKPEIWFCQVESQFTLSGITTEETKFHHLLAQLELKIVENIYDIVAAEEPNKYTLAKNRLLSIYKESSERQIKKLISDVELGDLKPSQLLRKMKNLSGTDVSEKVLKTLWLDKLPSHVRSVISIVDGDLDKLAEVGNRVYEMNSPHVNKISSTNDDKSLVSTMQELCERIAALETVRKKSGNQNRSRSRSRSRTHNLTTGCDASDTVPGRQHRLFVKDRRSGIKFLVDSGADVSVIPVGSKRGESTNFKLYAANGTEIPTFGTTVLNIDLGLRRIFEWPFFIAKTSKGILGADFLRKFDLLIDLKNKKLIDAKTKLTVSAAIDKISREEEALSSLIAENKFSDILK
ncbi:uncharacterized protein LOC123302848 [Chrysoperla carnea]|uniref:uncharacterized protein LOC123302848 n=1 Tax=Chrysoperla carnea TaxID=189513 RepID=UPI001D070348|nr:uncharacterized protein LOC123302848 [Chrysoperla carnea]